MKKVKKIPNCCSYNSPGFTYSQPFQTDAQMVLDLKLSYEHPPNGCAVLFAFQGSSLHLWPPGSETGERSVSVRAKNPLIGASFCGQLLRKLQLHARIKGRFSYIGILLFSFPETMIE